MPISINGQLQEVESAGHIPKFGGEIWYVDKVGGSNSNSGQDPHEAFETIKEGLSAMSAGDALNIKAGTYTETGLTLNLDGTEMWCEIGVLIDPVSGTALTISGASCAVKGRFKVTPDSAAVGVLVSGAECYLENGKVVGGTSGYQITGTGTILNECAGAYQAAGGISFDIQGAQTRAYRCKTVGNTTTTGYKISGTVDTGVLDTCTSAGHQTAGYHIVTGSSEWTILNCSSGANDGRWIDADDINVWTNFSYNDEVLKSVTFVDATQAFDLFTLVGTVEIHGIRGHVESALNGELGNCLFRVHGTDGPTNADLTTATACNSLPINSFIGKTATAGDALTVGSSAAPVVIENTNFKEPRVSTILVADNTGTTTIQFYSDDGAGNKDGQIHFHCLWNPISDDGFVSAA